MDFIMVIYVQKLTRVPIFIEYGALLNFDLV